MTSARFRYFFRKKPLNWCLSLTPVFPLSERSTCGYYMWRVPYFLIRVYQVVFSPLIPPSCRFQPSCSHYGAEALKTHGFWRGSWLTTKRVCKCHPWHPGGYDPVPIVKQSPKKSTEASSSALNTSANGDTAHG